MKNDEIIPIKKIFNIINSCISYTQLKTCENIIILYIKILKNKDVINTETVRENLFIRINEKKEEIYLSKQFKGSTRRKKIKIYEAEKELIENFY